MIYYQLIVNPRNTRSKKLQELEIRYLARYIKKTYPEYSMVIKEIQKS